MPRPYGFDYDPYGGEPYGRDPYARYDPFAYDEQDPLAEHLARRPTLEDPTKKRRALAAVAAGLGAFGGESGPVLQQRAFDIKHPGYRREMEEWKGEGQELAGLADIERRRTEQEQKTAAHEAGLATEKSRQEYYGAQKARLGAPSPPTPPKTLQEIAARDVAAMPEGTTPEEKQARTQQWQEILSDPQKKSTYEQKFDQRVKEITITGASQEEAEKQAAKEIGDVFTAELAQTRAQTARTQQLTELSSAMQRGDIKPQDKLRMLITSAQAISPWDPSAGLNQVAEELGIDLMDLLRGAFGAEEEETEGGPPPGAQTATNPDTGEKVYWDGKQWVPY